MGTLTAFLVMITLVIVVHEAGHYFVARAAGARVESFSVGFGPKLASFQIAGTEFRLCILPFGGYVKIEEESLAACSRPARLAIVLAGPGANFGLAVAILTALSVVPTHQPAHLGEPALLAWVEPDSAAGRAGIESGDRVIALGPHAIATWRDLITATAAAFGRGQPTTITLERDAKILQVPLLLSGDDRIGWAPPGERVRVFAVKKNSPAEAAGVQPGDWLVSADGEPLRSIFALRGPVEAAWADGERDVTIDILRDGAIVQMAIPTMLDEGQRRIGVSLISDYEKKPYQLGFAEALSVGTTETIRYTLATWAAVERLLTGRLSVEALSGPVGIYEHVDEARDMGGFTALVLLAVLLSINLGLLNLLPVPGLDGGQVAVLAVEILLRRDLSEIVKTRLTQAGMIALIALVLLVTWNDIARQIRKYRAPSVPVTEPQSAQPVPRPI